MPSACAHMLDRHWVDRPKAPALIEYRPCTDLSASCSATGGAPLRPYRCCSIPGPAYPNTASPDIAWLSRHRLWQAAASLEGPCCLNWGKSGTLM